MIICRFIARNSGLNALEPGSAGKAAETILEDYNGYVQTDGYPAYDSIFINDKAIIHVGCMAHLHRKLMDAAKDGVIPRQVKAADQIAVNKCDLVSGEQLEQLKAELKKLNPGAAVLAGPFGQFDRDLRRSGRSGTGTGFWESCNTRINRPDTITFDSSRISRNRLDGLLTAVQETVLRVKGYYSTEDGCFYLSDTGTGSTRLQPIDRNCAYWLPAANRSTTVGRLPATAHNSPQPRAAAFIYGLPIITSCGSAHMRPAAVPIYGRPWEALTKYHSCMRQHPFTASYPQLHSAALKLAGRALSGLFPFHSYEQFTVSRI